MYINNDFGLAMTDGFKASLAAANVRVVAQESYDPGESVDYSAKLAKVKAANPDVIWFGSQYNDLAMILKQAQRIGWMASRLSHRRRPIPPASSTSLATPRKTCICTLPSRRCRQTRRPRPSRRITRQSIRRRPAPHRRKPMKASISSAREAQRGGYTREGLQKALASMAPYAGPGGSIAFDPKTREAIGKTFTPLVVKGKSFALWDDCAKKLN